MKNVLVDYRITEHEKENLYKLGYIALEVPPSNLLYEAVCGHPDMLLHIVDNNIIVHRDMPLSFINKLNHLHYNIIHSNDSLDKLYPFDIRLNALNFGEIFLHTLKYTDLNLIKLIKNKRLLNVKQGYSKCSTAILSTTAAMTSDKGIYERLISAGIDVLFLPPGYINLPGLDYGFIGGCCGLLDEGIIAFYGNLDNYLYKDDVLKFLIKHDVKPISLGTADLIDRGSLFLIN